MVERLVEHPLRAALRTDRYTLAALDATLDLYLAQPIAWSSIPLAGLLSAPVENLKNRAERMAAQWSALANVESATAKKFCCSPAALGFSSTISSSCPQATDGVSPPQMTVSAHARIAKNPGKGLHWKRQRQLRSVFILSPG